MVSSADPKRGLTCQVWGYIVNGNIKISEDYWQLGHLLGSEEKKNKFLLRILYHLKAKKKKQTACVECKCINSCEGKPHFSKVKLPGRLFFFKSRQCARSLKVFIVGYNNRSTTNFLKSASSLSMSSLDSLLLSCLYRAEKRALLSRVPEASLNKGLENRRKSDHSI